MITAGEVFKKYRIETGKGLDEISQDTKIQKRFLEYLEENEYDKFDSQIFIQGFIKIYSNYLGLNEDKMLALYRRTQPSFVAKKKKEEKSKKKFDFRFNISPKSLSILLSSILLLSIVIYIGFQIYKFQSPPNITIQTPQNDYISLEDKIEVQGITDINTLVIINESENVIVDENGSFTHTVNLNPGVNIITIIASKNNNTLETVETIKVIFETPVEEEVIEEIQVNKVKLEIVNSSAWIQLNVDKENKISQILQAGEIFEYEVTESFSLSTGRILNTLIFFNDDKISIPTNSGNIGQLSCNILEDNQIDCK